MKRLPALFQRLRHSALLDRMSYLGIENFQNKAQKPIALTSSMLLVVCIFGIGHRLRIQVQQQTEFLESELILSVHEFNQLQREINRLHEQMVILPSEASPQLLELHHDLVQSRVMIIQKRLEGNDRSKDLGQDLSLKVEQILDDWQAIKPQILELQDNVLNQPLRKENAAALQALELKINRFTLLNQNRNRNRYRELLDSQRSSLNWLFLLLTFSFFSVFLFLAYVFKFIEIRQQMLEEMRQLSSTDELTQIPNRRQFNAILNQEWNRMMREQLPLAIILCDIDYFKRYNDFYGHQAGDLCLKRVAHALQEGMGRAGDFVARYGGEEFVIILPNTSLQSAVDIAAHLQTQIQSLALEHRQSDVSSQITFSMGISSGIPDVGVMPETALRYADQALYEAKRQGRDRACTSSFNQEPLTSNLR